MELKLIQNKIYEIRGVKVMLDVDLATMYQVETKQLKRAVKRNIERFEGEDFMFEVTREELSRCQFGTLNKGRGSNITMKKPVHSSNLSTSPWPNWLSNTREPTTLVAPSATPPPCIKTMKITVVSEKKDGYV